MFVGVVACLFLMVWVGDATESPSATSIPRYFCDFCAVAKIP
jgi:hypothetical protein